jgi:hypothetical protein
MGVRRSSAFNASFMRVYAWEWMDHHTKERKAFRFRSIPDGCGGGVWTPITGNQTYDALGSPSLVEMIMRVLIAYTAVSAL